jgi:peptidoglycan/LPS O-acetylase OafA/YrhL
VDCLRGLAACSVVAFHVANTFGVADLDGVLRHVTGRLEAGLWLFFVLSGFLLYRPFVAAALAREPRPSGGPYAWRRLLRIAPGYWVALTVTTLWLAHPQVFTAADLPRQFLLLQNYWADSYGQGLGQAWSLCVEVAFYAALPVYALLVGRIPVSPARRVPLELTLLAVVIGASIAYKWHALGTAGTLGSRYLPWYMDLFGAGMLLAVLHAHAVGRPGLPAPLRLIDRRPWLPVVLAFGVYLLMSFGLGFTGDYRQALDRGQIMERHLGYAVIAVLLLLPAVFGDPRRGMIRRVAGARVPVFLGTISYGIFLYQVLAMVLLLRWGVTDFQVPGLRYAVWLGGVLSLSIGFAVISWYVVERPVLGWKRRGPGRRRRRTASPSAAVPAGGAPAVPPA